MSVIVKIKNCIGLLRILSYNFTILIIDRRLIYDQWLITVVKYREKFIPIIADDNLCYIETRYVYMQASRYVLRIGNMYKLCNFLPIRISSVASLRKNEYESPIAYRTFIKSER